MTMIASGRFANLRNLHCEMLVPLNDYLARCIGDGCPKLESLFCINAESDPVSTMDSFPQGWKILNCVSLHAVKLSTILARQIAGCSPKMRILFIFSAGLIPGPGETLESAKEAIKRDFPLLDSDWTS